MKIKDAIILVAVGLFLGLVLSPFTNSRPIEAIKSPVSDSFALQNQENNSKATENKEAENTVEKYLAFFDKQQNFYNKQILGAKASSAKVDEQEEKEVNWEVNAKTGDKKIAFFGDSMIDTMGTDLPYLRTEIGKIYPNINFELRNYGIGATNIGTGLSRVDKHYNYQDRDYGAVTGERFDIIILGSFAYNPYEISEIEKYKNEMRQMIDKLKNNTDNLIFLATIAPLKVNFGKGPGGVNWPADIAYTHATKIQSFMEAGISVAKEKGIPVIDIYHQTLQTNGEGVANFVSTHDGIHPSISGHKFIASKISEFIAKNTIL